MLKLFKFKDIKELHPSKVYCIVVTNLVSKLLISNDFNLLHPLNIYFISFNFRVLKLCIFKNSKELQPLKILEKLVTKVVSKLLKSNDFNEVQL